MTRTKQTPHKHITETPCSACTSSTSFLSVSTDPELTDYHINLEKSLNKHRRTRKRYQEKTQKCARPETAQKSSLPKTSPKKPRSKITSVRQMIELQRTTNHLISLAPFVRVIREILYFYMPGAKVTPVALEGLQEAAEIYLVQLFEDSYRCTLHRDRVTLTAKDIALVRVLRGVDDAGNQ